MSDTQSNKLASVNQPVFDGPSSTRKIMLTLSISKPIFYFARVMVVKQLEREGWNVSVTQEVTL